MKKSKFLNLSLLSITIIGGVTFTGTSLIKNSETLDKNTSFNFFGVGDEIDNNGEIRFLELESDFAGAVIRDPVGKDHLYMWGNNSAGQLGIEDVSYVSIPTEVELPIEGEVKDFAIGGLNSAMVITNEAGEDELYTWGTNVNGALGNGEYSTEEDFNSEIKRNNIKETNINSIQVGDHNMGAWTTNPNGDDFIYTWGYNNMGQLGVNFLIEDNFFANPMVTPIVNSNILSRGVKVEDYKVASDNSLLLIRDTEEKQHLYGWGWNDKEELGSEGNSILPSEIIEIPENKEIEKIQLSKENSAILSKDVSSGDEEIFVGGSNEYGQIINSTSHVSSSSPISFSNENKVNFYTSENEEIKKIESISMGNARTSIGVIGTDSLGNDHLFMWGSNEYGQISHDATTPSNIVEVVLEINDLPENSKIVNFKTQRYSSIVLLEDSFGSQSLYTWGTNHNGVLGIGDDLETISTSSTPISTKNSHSTITTFNELVKDHIFTFKIDSPIEINKELLIYNQNNELIGIAKFDVENDLYYGLILNGKDLNDQILYWSNGFDKTLNLISEDTYSFDSIEWVSNIPTIDWELIKDKIIEIVWNYIVAGITSDVIENLKDEIIETIQELGLEEFFNSVIDYLVENEINDIINSPSFQENFDKIKEIIVRNTINDVVNSDGFDDKWNEIIDEIIENNSNTDVDSGENDNSNTGLIVVVSILSIVLIALIVTLIVMYFINKGNDDEDDSEEEFISNKTQLA